MKNIPYLLLLFLLVTTVNAEEDKNFILRKKIQETQRQIEDYNNKKKETDKKITEFQDSHSKRITKRKKDISKLSIDVSQLERELKGKKIEKIGLERAVKNHEIQFLHRSAQDAGRPHTPAKV